jgi:hypothetical protein
VKNDNHANRILKLYIKETIMKEFSMIDTMYATVGNDSESDVSKREDEIENQPTTIAAHSTLDDLADHLQDDEDLFGPVPPDANDPYVEMDPYASDYIAGTRNVGWS